MLDGDLQEILKQAHAGVVDKAVDIAAGVDLLCQGEDFGFTRKVCLEGGKLDSGVGADLTGRCDIAAVIVGDDVVPLLRQAGHNAKAEPLGSAGHDDGFSALFHKIIVPFCCALKCCAARKGLGAAGLPRGGSRCF